jgi:outer membrane protein OmpA-like peptidoglycan-associated protein
MSSGKNMTHRIVSSLVLVVSVASGACATVAAPQELVDARSAYNQGLNGKAQQLNPAGLHEAKVALDAAENAFVEHPSESRTKDLAYIAWRRAQRAELEAQTSAWEAQHSTARQAAMQAQAKATQAAQSQLAEAKQQLENERNARQAAETRAREVLDRLVAANAAAVRQEPRGTVITLSGGVLFESNKAALLPGAQNSLGQIAEALAADPSKKIVVEGHTDSRGAPESNLALSRARAEAVAQFLVARGIDVTRVSSNGLGAGRPVGDNETAEGRASNRRVEIIIQPGEAS